MKPLSIVFILLCSISLVLGATLTPCGPDMAGMPSDNWMDDTYSPFLCYRLTGLTPGRYTMMIWALETITPLPAVPDCAGPQNSLCGHTVTFDNTGDNFRATREIWVLETVQNFAWAQFHFVVRLWNGQVGPILGVGCQGQVENCWEQYVPATQTRPPVLERMRANVETNQGRLVRIQAKATGDTTTGDRITYQVYPSLPGMRINRRTGLLQWTPTKAGNYSIVISAFQGEDIPLYDSQIINIRVNRPVGLPTPRPRPARVVTARLVEVERDSPINCRWWVTISLKNFQPGTIDVIGRGTLSPCGASTASRNYFWSGPGLIQFKENNDEFTFIHNDFGNYTYIFTDSKNQTASVNFTVPRNGGLQGPGTTGATKTTTGAATGNTKTTTGAATGNTNTQNTKTTAGVNTKTSGNTKTTAGANTKTTAGANTKTSAQ